MIRRFTTATLLALALPAAAQSIPAANYSDIWYNASESGWGVTFTQHPSSNQVEAVWYTYDPRQPDPSFPGNFKPLWIFCSGGTWPTPTRFTGDVFVTLGTPFSLPWAFPSGLPRSNVSKVGTFTFDFTSTSTGTFTYNISIPAGLASTDPAFGLPSFSGTKAIVRQPF
jgi:hypothetical protein